MENKIFKGSQVKVFVSLERIGSLSFFAGEGGAELIAGAEIKVTDGVEGFWDCVTNTFIEPIS